MSGDAERRDLTIVANKVGAGADVLGFDFDTMPSHQVGALRSAWLKYGILRFRGYDLTDEHQLNFLKREEDGAPTTYKDDEKVTVMTNLINGVPSGAGSNVELEWHTDSWFWEYPPVGEILRAMELPQTGGDTYWADMYAVYDALPEDLRSTIEGRLIQFDTVYNGHGNLRKGKEAPKTDDFRLWEHIRHPIIRTHPESGRKAVFVGQSKHEKNWIVGLPLEESKEILAKILSYVEKPEFQLHQKWQPGDTVIWDNRCTMHRRETWPDDQTRIMHRTTCNTKGQPRPFYVY
ncbi:alpha-ketoglutarate-dependent taurine dioxygenase, putative [Talaromyces stipitatus ATCC 10500]|uniref:Alpha-ketoglutarate-dependent taurine dioxygenase, putative n=1 Tax=Talaromyces stipitatus (strain ATCC 10500 / CBS 375.48 / QM 6759 / NRRL 1006) TaxID=441959 RepID=B8MCL4_TALSN|nr:alpha-ketoglutarate-dependent taurine dioxygenase, putative [Talaromyces stipitatus ATCC 10500]EED18830.1 alpha-ketoglutarate-dependent taurine dioxygenase, putative [Talaromyces stipitatus ATCC 10500]